MSLITERSLFVHQFNVQAEKSVTAIARTAIDDAQTHVVLLKVMDREEWMADFDRRPDGSQEPAAISSLASWQAAVAEGAAAGITLIPWINPSRLSEAATHAQLGPEIVLDLEPYNGFWQDTPGHLVQYLQALRDLGVTTIHVTLDPRRSAESSLDLAAWGSSVQSLLPELYWTDFGQAALDVVPMLPYLLGFGVPVIPVLPHDGSADFGPFWDAAKQLGCAAPCLWVFGFANLVELEAFGALDTAPADPCAALFAEIEQLQAEIASETTANTLLQSRIDEIAAIASGK